VSQIQGSVSDDPGRIIYELEERLAAETKRTEQAQQYVSDANESLNEKAAKIERLQARLAEHGAEIDRLRLQIRESNAHYDRMRLEFTAAQQLRSENERLQAEIERLRTELLQSEARNTADTETAEYAARLEMQLDNSRDALRDLQEDHTAMDHRAEGARSAYLAVIKALWEMRR
jgi:chromosome segregation ATPase